MINNGGKSGGNPYHDENGHFTSKDKQGSGIVSQKVNQNTGNQPVDFAASIWNDFLKSQEQPKKTTGEKVLNQMGLTSEEVMETHKEQSDQKALDDLGEKMDKLEEEVEYDDIDADYERSYGPVNSPEKYEAYQKWLENGHSFDNQPQFGEKEDIMEALGEQRDLFDESVTVGEVANTIAKEVGTTPDKVMNVLREEAKSYGNDIDENTNYKEWWQKEEQNAIK